MAYVITDKCKNCGACAEQCPVSAISAGNGKYEICPDTCIECNACAAQCPTDGAIEGQYALDSRRVLHVPAFFVCLFIVI